MIAADALSGQESGIAVEESPFQFKVNPALMSTGNSEGLAWTGDFDENGLSNNYSVILSGNNLAYYYDSLEGDKFHNFALSLPVLPGFNTAASVFFP